LLAGGVGLVAGFAAGFGGVWVRDRARLTRLEEGIGELASDNLAHRVIMPGSDRFALMADDLNGLAEAIQIERESASAADRARRQFVANISHDLRTPITSVAGYVDALQRGLGDEPDRYLAVIGAKVGELVQLTDDLFYAARIDAGDLELTLGRMDLAEAVRRSVLGFEPELAAMNVRVDLRIPDERCPVDADASAVARVLSNLISNNVRHGESMTEFGVTMTDESDGYSVRLCNDGPSLPSDIERLFDRGVTGSRGGAGLGLSIARELAQRMSATVSAENLAGGGVRFTLVFPKPTDPRLGSPEFSGS
jgi:signal transduction histidine kinase